LDELIGDDLAPLRRERPAAVVADSGMQLGGRLWEDYQAFRQARVERIRDQLSGSLTALPNDCVLVPSEACPGGVGYTVEGRRVLLHLMAGSKEDVETGGTSKTRFW